MREVDKLIERVGANAVPIAGGAMRSLQICHDGKMSCPASHCEGEARSNPVGRAPDCYAVWRPLAMTFPLRGIAHGR
jgi:hypothetical protein